jgi:hypothetical protein
MTLSKTTSALIFLFIASSLSAQKPIAPSGLAASFKKFNNRIELTWNATDANHQYKIFRAEQAKKTFEAVATVNQNRFVDRNNLEFNKSYLYRVKALAPDGSLSDDSNQAVGALVVLAMLPDFSQTNTPQPLEDCISVNLSAAKATAQSFALKFIVSTNCDMPKAVQMTLYRSDDATFDEKDDFIIQESFDLSRKRGVLTAKNQGETTTGYLLLKVETPEESFIVARKIE